MIATADQQIAAMARVWPDWRVLEHDARYIRWGGPLRPLLQTYAVEIRYRVPMLLERQEAALHQPRVSIVAPALRPRVGDSKGRLPHVYYLDDGSIALCLLDPDAGDWSPADLIAETTVPWTIDWLAAYEGWRATGSWTASGRHVERANG